ncbi:lipoprotein BA_5634 family protein [Psychrobacillus psychrodurans]|uniref:Lipoprotein BA_5634 family protein n=1 Tax=Psychrobacillus psychrodurans TaxID=126157 RepID=A0A9X3RAF9_9BACI|nr:lipoprotein BA_5634 family protein [Psychrobacillus psychrodurans]MCZ8534599.1 lipoprotein BA_5634 family protein [Psychrobacillus psychrodurans]
MRKLLIVFLTTLIVASILTGCNMFAKANGVILYGEEQQILDSLEREKDDLAKEDQYKIKVMENDGQQIIVLTDETVQALVKKKLIKEITNQEKGKTKAISSLPKVAEGEGILFAKKEPAALNLEGKDLNVEYEGNLIIGEGRAYGNMFLIVNDADFDSIKGTEKMMALLEYDKDPSADGLDYDVEKTQLVRIQE